ncbi:MAG: hypothetical protein D6780_07555, partial [Candidatus Dadabacteria bacterium]
KKDSRLRTKIVKERAPRRKKYKVDLRVHSPASLGYMAIKGIDTAPAIVRLARVKGLDVIAVTDFYSGRFIDSVKTASEESDLIIIPGVTIRGAIHNCNDVILTCLFPESYTSKDIEEFLLGIGVPESSFGDSKYLVTMPFERLLKAIEDSSGIAIPSKMDKTPYRMNAIPILVEDYGFRVFDLAYPDTEQFFKKRWPKLKFQLFTFSSASALAQVGSRSATVQMKAPGYEGLQEIIRREG